MSESENIELWEFGNIEELHFKKSYDYINSKYIYDIDMILENLSGNKKVKLYLHNVRGCVEFDCVNGFFSGFLIEDYRGRGFEEDCSFHISTFEQGACTDLYCEKIELLKLL